MPNDNSIAILLPSRARTDSLSKSVFSIVDRASQPDRLEFLFGFDDDDNIGIDHFTTVIQPWLDQHEIDYEVLSWGTLGYEGLNQYYNTLAQSASADWLFVWNDDAIMETQAWDDVVRCYDSQFQILKVHTHNEHPYSIFPIVPCEWVDVVGVLSRHQMIDAEISQNAYMLDVMQIVDISVTHEQSELTGKQDATSARKNRFEGNPNDPRDFHYRSTVLQRLEDCKNLSEYMQSKNLDVTFYKNVVNNQQDPWEKLKKNDINQHMFTFTQQL